jgi:hypothetical protein
MPQTFKLSVQQRDLFDRDGVVALPGFLPAPEAAAMADALWADLRRRFAIDRRNPATWAVERPMHFQDVIRAGAFARLAELGYPQLADAFLGEGWTHAADRWAQPLVTFRTGEWDVPHAGWHLDLPAAPSLERMPALRVFCFLEPVAPLGGGTNYIAGSHRAVIDRARQGGRSGGWRSAHMRAALTAEEPWLAALTSPGGGDRVRRFMSAGAKMRGIDVRVGEMTGEPGDVIVMHPAMIHCGAPNALEQPRMMLVETFWAKGVRG